MSVQCWQASTVLSENLLHGCRFLHELHEPSDCFAHLRRMMTIITIRSQITMIITITDCNESRPMLNAAAEAISAEGIKVDTSSFKSMHAPSHSAANGDPHEVAEDTSAMPRFHRQPPHKQVHDIAGWLLLCRVWIASF